MAYPYLTDVVNELTGTSIHLPIATFGALVAIAIFVAIRFTRVEVERLAFTNKRLQLHNHQPKSLVTDLAFVVTLSGIAGAKLFDAIEQPRQLLTDPIGVIFSTGGFSIYGGLILGCIAGIIFVKRKAIAVVPMLDAVAPALALGYGIGRLGCQFSGDGDWGKPAAMEIKPNWLPDWFWAQTYPNNVLQVGIPVPGVYPTPLYEAVVAFITFALLWALRKKFSVTGQLFCCYLLLSSLARFLVEFIRINYQYEFFGIFLSQAQIIALVLAMMSVVGFVILKGSNK
ncbi:prolipoprotein diacylglyceryl transferase [Cellvibrio sp. KY-GH-1]|uniref:prolipoprotein diacylglyceryl transferase n=1 Tax=Cellvibrio sp. KY-GH-1 TaxID=2303332 RepID=UPI001244D169|nr:prolipoprotein diacylglyceryl transferase family protein [Cellvibrio sp. KY-GH-1]QEY17581.1 prolipoprotein diacylglyceryl transferase [Cellvibrio sp. KY-GH-1]